MAVEENTKITDEQVHGIYTELAKDDKEAEKLEKAQSETEQAEYSKVEEMNGSVNLGGVDTADVNEGRKDYLDAFSPYNINDEDAVKLLEIISDFKAGKKDNIYNRLPDEIKKIADGMAKSPDARQAKVSKEWAASFLISNFISDAKLNKALDEFNEEMNEAVASMNKEYGLIFNEAIDEIFSQLETIRAEDPERAASIEAVKKAFEDAVSFERQLEYVEHLTPKKLNKYHGGKRLSNDVFYFNKKVNVTEIRVPDIGELPAIIKMHLPEYGEDEIMKFVSILVKTTTILPLEGLENLGNLAYVYKMIDNIYNYKYSGDAESETYKTIFGNIAKVLDKIKSLS